MREFFDIISEHPIISICIAVFIYKCLRAVFQVDKDDY